jgi:hypothetical protein
MGGVGKRKTYLVSKSLDVRNIVVVSSHILSIAGDALNIFEKRHEQM